MNNVIGRLRQTKEDIKKMLEELNMELSDTSPDARKADLIKFRIRFNKQCLIDVTELITLLEERNTLDKRLVS